MHKIGRERREERITRKWEEGWREEQ